MYCEFLLTTIERMLSFEGNSARKEPLGTLQIFALLPLPSTTKDPSGEKETVLIDPPCGITALSSPVAQSHNHAVLPLAVKTQLAVGLKTIISAPDVTTRALLSPK